LRERERERERERDLCINIIPLSFTSLFPMVTFPKYRRRRGEDGRKKQKKKKNNKADNFIMVFEQKGEDFFIYIFATFFYTFLRNSVRRFLPPSSYLSSPFSSIPSVVRIL
jgi:hypothetical protein